MNIAKQCLLSAVAWVVVSAPSHAQQLADTIWEGRVRISSLSPQLYENGVANVNIQAVNATFFLPVEIWFKDATHFLVVLRRDKIEPVLEDTTAHRYELVAGLHPDDRDFQGGGGRYLTSATYARRGGGYTFVATQKTIQSGVAWSVGSQSTLSGKFSVKGNTLTLNAATLTYAPNPPGPDDYRLNPPFPKLTGTFTRVANRKPSTEFPDWPRGR